MMKTLCVIFSILLIVCVLQITNSYSMEWAKTYGEIVSKVAYDIRQTTDGGYIVVGITYDPPVASIWIMKLDDNGNICWEKKYAGSNAYTTASSIQETAGGGYIVSGQIIPLIGDNGDILILKLYSNGDIEWQKSYGGNGIDYSNSIQQTDDDGDGEKDDGYLLVGSSWSFGAGSEDMWILKLEENGNITWQNTYGGTSQDSGTHFQQTEDGNFIVAGSTFSFGDVNGDIWIVKLDTNGNVIWGKSLNGSMNDSPWWIQQTTEGGYIVVGYLNNDLDAVHLSDIDMWVLKLYSNGDIEWQKSYGGNYADVALKIQQTEGGYLLGGVNNYYASFYGTGDGNMWLLKLDNNGNVGSSYPGTWQKTYGGPFDDDLWGFQQTTDGGFILAGHTPKSFGVDAWNTMVLKLDSSGEIPGCDITDSRNLVVTETSSVGQPTTVNITQTSISPAITNLSPQAISSEVSDICDIDEDGIFNLDDNCPIAPNGPNEGTCIRGEYYGELCTNPGENTSECGINGFCSMNQEDNYPPGGNNCGDVCECEGDFEPEGDVDGTDAIKFKLDFYRSDCSELNPCNGDFNCDGDVDGTDAIMFKLDFFRKDCPTCGGWPCGYK